MLEEMRTAHWPEFLKHRIWGNCEDSVVEATKGEPQNLADGNNAN